MFCSFISGGPVSALFVELLIVVWLGYASSSSLLDASRIKNRTAREKYVK